MRVTLCSCMRRSTQVVVELYQGYQCLHDPHFLSRDNAIPFTIPPRHLFHYPSTFAGEYSVFFPVDRKWNSHWCSVLTVFYPSYEWAHCNMSSIKVRSVANSLYSIRHTSERAGASMIHITVLNVNIKIYTDVTYLLLYYYTDIHEHYTYRETN